MKVQPGTMRRVRKLLETLAGGGEVDGGEVHGGITLGDLQAAYADARALLPLLGQRKPPKKALPFMPRKAAKRAKAATRRERVGEIRAAVFKRADEVCEHAGCHSRATDLDHELGGANRRALESIETCRALCWTCHRLKTDNVPSRHYWASDFARHCARHGYPVPSRVAAELDAAEAQP